MKRCVWFAPVVLLAISLVAFGQMTATAPTAATQPRETKAATQPRETKAATQPRETKVAPPVPGGRRAAEALCEEAIAYLADGRHEKALEAIDKAQRLCPDEPAIAEVRTSVVAFVERRTADEADRRVEYDQAVAKARILLEIARHVEEPGEPVKRVRDRVEDVREVVVDLLGAPLIEENIKSEDWYARRLDTDGAKIAEEVKKILGELEPAADEHVEHIRVEVADLTEALDAFAAGAVKHDWSSLDEATKSLDALQEQTEALAQATDDLSAVVSEKPWRAALDRLRLVKLVSGGDRSFFDEPWATAIVEGAAARAREYQQERKWYDALSLYTMLEDLYDNDGRYEAEVKHVTRRARVLSLYAPDALADAEAERDDSPEAVEEDDEAVQQKWKDYIRGVDAFMVRLALARIDETYVKSVDYKKVLLGGLRAVEALVHSPEVEQAFPSMADEAKRRELAEKIASIIETAEGEQAVSYRAVGATLNKVLWANRRTVGIPDEVIDVEFTDGMMKELDRFSSMIWPSEWPEFKKHTMGSFKGVGIQIQVQPQTDLLMVVSPLENSPAYRAGIKAGDFIMKINGVSSVGIDIEEAVKQITGPEGTKVVLTIKRPGRDDLFDASLEREEIHIQTVKGWKRTNGGGWDWMIDPDTRIGYVRLTSFNRETTSDLQRALLQMRSEGARGLILDLRSNPGGLLSEAVGVTDQFVRDGTIVSTKGRQKRAGELAATPDGAFLDGELVVLIDEHSASAAEIVSGALKDLDRAVIVGKRSFGKGSVQNLIPIREDRDHMHDAYLKLTTAYYYLPSDRCLHRTEGATEWGVEPDIEPVVTPRQLRRWLTLRRRTEIIKQREQGDLDADMARQFRADIPLDTALLVCQLRLLDQRLESDPLAATATRSADDAEPRGDSPEAEPRWKPAGS